MTIWLPYPLNNKIHKAIKQGDSAAAFYTTCCTIINSDLIQLPRMSYIVKNVRKLLNFFFFLHFTPYM